MMKFKVGDRIHVLRFENKDADFIATIKHVLSGDDVAYLEGCSDSKYNGHIIYLPTTTCFDVYGKDKRDYLEKIEDQNEHKFKIGDRVHVTRHNRKEVDFYATLKECDYYCYLFLTDCSNENFENIKVYKQNTRKFGLNICDYYTLAKDEPEERKFKAGDRVHVTRHNNRNVDFYGTIGFITGALVFLNNCSYSENRKVAVYLPPNKRFGKDKEDYYELVEEPVCKNGDRVHVTSWHDKKVDFYASLKDTGLTNVYQMINTSNPNYDGCTILKPHIYSFGKDKRDHYTLAKDESKETTKTHQMSDHYIIEINKGFYVKEVTSNDYFKFTNDINQAVVYKDESIVNHHSKLIGGEVLKLKRYVETN